MHFKIRYHASLFEKYREHYLNAVGVYKECPEDSSLVGQVPVELSRLVASFLGASKMNSVSVQICRNRKREVGLIGPGLYRARKMKKKFGKILSKEVTECYRYFDFSLEHYPKNQIT